MRIVCTKCYTSFDDDNRSTVCPHKGLGYCEICDCVICVCDPARKEKIHASRMPKQKQATHEYPCDCGFC